MYLEERSTTLGKEMETVLVDYDIQQITKKDGHGPQGLTPQHGKRRMDFGLKYKN